MFFHKLDIDSFTEANLEKKKILERNIYRSKDKSQIEYDKTLNKNLTFEENLYLQRTNYMNIIKANTEIFFLLMMTT